MNVIEHNPLNYYHIGYTSIKLCNFLLSLSLLRKLTLETYYLILISTLVLNWEEMEGWVPIKALTSHVNPKSHTSLHFDFSSLYQPISYLVVAGFSILHCMLYNIYHADTSLNNFYPL